jgi:acetylornithine deacetylase
MIRDIDILTAESVALLKEMIAIESPSFSEEAVCSHISGWLSDKGVAHERVGNNIIATHMTDESRPTLMLCAHIDTVAASPDYEFDPYNPDYHRAAEVISGIRGESLTASDIVAGLGSNDDGASVVAMIAAFRYFSETDVQGERGIQNDPSHYVGPSPCGQGGSTVLNTSLTLNEEQSQKKTDDAVIGTACGKSICNIILVLTCEEERSGKNGMTGLWGSRLCSRAEAKDGCIAVDFAIVGEPTEMKAAVAERGLLVIDATAYGVSGHAARNEGKNALYIALEDIQKLRHHEFERISQRMGKVNLNVTQIHSGTAHNVIPDRCDFVIDIRPTEQYTNEEILEELESICSSELKPRNLANRSSATHEDSPLQCMAERMGIETFSSATTSDWMRIGCDAIKMGPGESIRSHRKDEFVYIDEIRNAIETYIEFINTL